MSVPASSYSYSEYTVAPSEASLNARWYNQIQQWTNRLGLESPSSAAPGNANGVVQREDTMRRRDVDQGTEAGTVLPTHSVSRRASMAERRRWMEQMAEPKAKTATHGGDTIDNVTTPGQRERRPVVHAGTTSDQPAQCPSHSKASLPQEVNDAQKIAFPRDQTARLESIAIRTGTDVPPSTRTPNIGDVSTRPTRGRRAPTPYHPPSDVALTEIPESSVGDRGESLQRERSTRQTEVQAVVQPRRRYPPSAPRTMLSTKKHPEREPPNLHTKSQRTTVAEPPTQEIPSIVSRSRSPRIVPSTQTANSSFPPLSTNPHDMTVVPEDSISRVEPRPSRKEEYAGSPTRRNGRDRGRRDRGRDVDEERYRRGATRSSSREREMYASHDHRRQERSRVLPRTRRRTRSSGRSESSDSDSSQSSVSSRSRSVSSDTSTPRLGKYPNRTLSPPVHPPGPTIVTSPFRISSPAVGPLLRPPIQTYPYMPQPLSPPPITPIHPHSMAMQMGSQLNHNPWPAMSNMSSIGFSPPPTAFMQPWSSHLGPQSQAAFGNPSHTGPMQQVFGNMSLADAWMNTSRRGSTPQLMNTAAVSGQQGVMGGNMRPPRPLRAASVPMTGGGDRMQNFSTSRLPNTSSGKPSARPFDIRSATVLPVDRTKGLSSVPAISGNVRLRGAQPRVSGRTRGGEAHGATRMPQRSAGAVQSSPSPMGSGTPRRSSKPARRSTAITGPRTDARPISARGGKGLGWMKGLLPPYGRPPTKS